MRTVSTRIRQMMEYKGGFYTLDIKGNIWLRDMSAPQGWRMVQMPTIELPDYEPITQGPQNLKGAFFPMPPRTAHFDKEEKKGWIPHANRPR